MPRKIHEFEGILIEFDNGKFDEWCVYVKKPTEARLAPTDEQYFRILFELGAIYGANVIYQDFVEIFNMTSKEVDGIVLNKIHELSQKYGEHSTEIKIWFTVLYAGMIAEENKAFTRLGKRIKRLGMHQAMHGLLSPEQAAKYSWGKSWRDLDTVMKNFGF